MSVTQPLPSLPPQYALIGPLLRRVATVVVVMALIFLVMSAVTAFNANTARLLEQHNSTLTRTTAQVQEQLQVFLSVAGSLSTEINLRNYALGLSADVNAAAAALRATIRRDPTLYRSIRYVDASGVLRFEVNNVNGVPLLSEDVEAELVENFDWRVGQHLERFQNAGDGLYFDRLPDAMAQSEAGLVANVITSIFADNITKVGFLVMEVDSSTLLSAATFSEGVLFEEQPGRRLTFLDENLRLLADSDEGDEFELVDEEEAVATSLDVDTPDSYRLQAGSGFLRSRESVGLRANDSGRLWVYLFDDLLTAYAPAISTILAQTLLVLAAGGLALVVINRLVNQALTPVVRTLTEVDQLAEGQSQITSTSQAVHTLQQRLGLLSASVERQKQRYQRDILVAGRISRDIVTLPEIDVLANRIINMVCNEMGFYHAQVYLLSRTSDEAVLRYSRGEVGRLMIEQGRRIRIGTGSVVGYAIQERRPNIINDTVTAQQQGRHLFNPLLPETRAEIALPMFAGDEVIGVIDVQSRERDAFRDEVIPTLQLLADQLAMAIYNARLRRESEERYQQIDRLNRQLTRSAWDTAETQTLTQTTFGTLPENGETIVSAPITIRGETIGTLTAALPDGASIEGEGMIVQAVAERVALAMENARLFQETQLSLSETQTLYQLSRQLNEAEALEDLLQAIIMSVTPDATRAQIWLFMENERDELTTQVRLHTNFIMNPRQRARLAVGVTFDTGSQLVTDLGEESLYVVEDVQTAPPAVRELAANLQEAQIGAFVLLPFTVRGVNKGFVTIDYDTPRAFGERERRLFKALAAQTSVAVDNRLLLHQTEEALSRNENLYAASRIINTSRTLEDLLMAVVTTSDAAFYTFELALLEGEAERGGWTAFARVVARSLDGEVESPNTLIPLHVDAQSPMRQREPEVWLMPAHRDAMTPQQHLMVRNGWRMLTLFPLFSENLPLAVFSVASPLAEPLSPTDVEAYRALAGQMSTQIQNRRLLQRTEQALSETRRLYVAGSTIAAAMDLSSLYQTFPRYLAQPILNQIEGLELSLSLLMARPDAVPNAPLLEIVYDWSSTASESAAGQTVLHEDAPFAALLANSDNEHLLYDPLPSTFETLPELHRLLAANDAHSAIVMPLRSRQRWFGVLLIRSSRERLFDDSYIKFMQAFVGQATLAVERQILLQETERERANLNAILSTLPAGVLVLDPHTLKPLQANESVQTLLGQPIDAETPFTAERYRLFRSNLNVIYPNEELPISVARVKDRAVFADDIAVSLDGYQIDLLINAAPIYDDAGGIRAIVTAFQDISSIRTLESELQNRLRETTSLYNAQQALAQAETLEAILDTAFEQIMAQDPPNIYIVLTRLDTQEMYVARTAHPPRLPLERVMPLLTAEPIHIAHTDDDERLSPEVRAVLHEIGAQSLYVLPLTAKARSTPLGWFLIVYDQPDSLMPDIERFYNSLGEMATSAIDNNYLFRSTQLALQETDYLYQATTSISRSNSFQSISEALETALRALNPDVLASYMQVEYEGRNPVRQFEYGFETCAAAGVDVSVLLTTPLPTTQNVTLIDLSSDTPDLVALELVKDTTLHACAVVTLRVKQAAHARLFIAYRQPHSFNSSEIRLMSSISDTASVVVDNQMLLEQVQANLQEASVLYQASRALIEASTPDQVVSITEKYLVEPHNNQIFVALLNTTSWTAKDAAITIASTWRRGPEVDLQGVILTEDQFPPWRLMTTETVLVIDDIHAPDSRLTEHERTSIESMDAHSLVIVPLRVGSRAIGAIWLSSREPHTYTQSNLRIFQSFSEQTSLSLEAARSLAEAERRARQLEASASISHDIGQLMDLDLLLPRVVDLIRETFGYDHVQVFLTDEKSRYALLRASTGDAGRKLLNKRHRIELGAEGVVGQMLRTGKQQIAVDTADDGVIHMANPELPYTRSELAVPLIVGDTVVGALDVQSNTPNAFREQDIQALVSLGAQISVAIENTRLFADARQRAIEMTYLFDITSAATTADTLEDALRSAARLIVRMMDTRALAIYMPIIYEDYEQNQMILLRARTLEEVTRPASEFADVRRGDPDHVVGVVADSLQMLVIPDVAEDTRYPALTKDAQSALIIPISTGSDLIAVVMLESARLDAFGEQALTLAMTLGGALGATIQNHLLVAQLQSTNDKLIESDRLKSQFLASMSHELRTPLNSIIGFSKVMLKGISGPLSEMQEQDLTTIYNSGNHLLNLINDILDQAKIENNELKLKFDFFEVRQMVEGVKSIAIGLIKDKPLRLIVETAQGMPRAYGDEFRTRQILLNLVSNAVKFTPEGTITVQAYPAHDEQGRLVVRVDVMDTGIGIGEKDISQLFQRFRQVDSSLTRTVGGTGLGLAISKSLVEMQGGQVFVESQVGVGSKFSFSLPTEPVPEAAAADVDAPPANLDTQPERPKTMSDTQVIPKKLLDTRTPPPMPALSGLNMTRELPVLNMKRDVLLIEDSKDMVDQYRRALQREGYEVQTADHPSYARAMVGQLRPSLVIMDVNFANGQGWEILKDLKEQDETFDIPIIVCTLSPDSERVYRLGAYAFLQRPILPDVLVETVKKAEQENRSDRILIIDDEPESVRLLKQVLTQNGAYRVFSAESGEAGISLVARRRPDLIILDLRMPGMDGFKVLHELRSNPETARIPILIVTGEMSFDSEEQKLLQNVRVLYKTDLSEEEYERFLADVKTHLSSGKL